MATSNSIEIVLNDAVNSLHTLWTLVEKSLGDGTDWAVCELALEMLPLIGGKLDAVVGAMGGGQTGVFDEALSARGIKINAVHVEARAACQQSEVSHA